MERCQLGHRTPAVGDDPFGPSFGLAYEAAELCLGLADSNRQTLHVVIVVLQPEKAVRVTYSSAERYSGGTRLERNYSDGHGLPVDQVTDRRTQFGFKYKVYARNVAAINGIR